MSITVPQALQALEQARLDSRPSEMVLPGLGAWLGTDGAAWTETEPTMDAIRALPQSLARRFGAVPLAVEGELLVVAVTDPTDQDSLQELMLGAGMAIRPVGMSADRISLLQDRAYPREQGAAAPGRRQRGLVESAATRLVNDLLHEALHQGASDIHVEPHERELIVRFRVDGALKIVRRLPPRTTSETLSRIMVMSGMDIAEKRRPQDGRIRLEENSRPVDVRVSALPTEFGHKMVMRLLDRSAVALDLATVGLAGEQLKLLQQNIKRPYGMVLVTGPTGSGKTTTLYSAVSAIRDPAINITTIEDPVEYRLEGITQTQVKSEIGLTFAAALRTILRQDPNVVLVGEIRDGETAELAIRAALTGHLVFSTLHTNDSATAATRLVDMGVEPFLVSSSLSLVVAQRLVRRSCQHCLKPYQPAEDHLLWAKAQGMTRATWQKGEGCFRCGQTGFRGRIGIFEMLPITEMVRQAIQGREDAARIKDIAVQQGMRTLALDGLEKAGQGLTTLEEVFRETVA